jgi:hypothetical protein
MSRRIFVPQLEHSAVLPILNRHRWKLPSNVTPAVARWHFGWYYGYGSKESWIPLNPMGGIATHAFQGLVVKFPAKIDAKLRALLEEKKTLERSYGDARPA